jgi:type III secretory pathway component EscR
LNFIGDHTKKQKSDFVIGFLLFVDFLVVILIFYARLDAHGLAVPDDRRAG